MSLFRNSRDIAIWDIQTVGTTGKSGTLSWEHPSVEERRRLGRVVLNKS